MSSAERWNRIRNIFDAALERAPEERSSFICEQCGTDEALQADVQSLLAAHESAGPLFARPAIHALRASAVAAIDGALE